MGGSLESKGGVCEELKACETERSEQGSRVKCTSHFSTERKHMMREWSISGPLFNSSSSMEHSAMLMLPKTDFPFW